MKKQVLTIVLAIAMAASLSACGSSGGAATTAAATEAAATEAAATEAAATEAAAPETEEPAATEASAADYSGQTVRVTSWGGTYEETLTNLVKPEFEARTGATLEVVLGSAPLAQLKAEGSDPSVDVCHMNYYETMQGQSLGVLAEIDYDRLSNAADLWDVAKAEKTGVITNWGSRGIAYRNDLIDEVTSWADLWKPEYAGKVIVSDVTFGGGYELAEMTAITFFNEDLTNKDCWDEVFDKLAELAPNVYLVSTEHATTDTALINGDAVIAVHTNGRTAMVVNDGHPEISYAHLKEGEAGMGTYAGITKETPVEDLAYEMLDELIGPSCELAYCEHNFYAPSNTKCEIPEDLKPFMPYTQEQVDNLIYFDSDSLSDEDRAEFVERWNKCFKQ